MSILFRATRRPANPTEAITWMSSPLHCITDLFTDFTRIKLDLRRILYQSHIIRILSVSKRAKRESVTARRESASAMESFSPRKKLSIPRLRTYEVNKDNDNTEICKYEHRCKRDYPTLDTHF